MNFAMRFISASLLLALGMSTGLGWGNGTHTHFSKQLGAHHGLPNLNEMYGAVLVDAFNLVLDEKGQFMADLMHHNAMAVTTAATTCEQRAAAFGFVSHNDTWGADWTAHHQAHTLTGGGYAVLKGAQLAITLTPALYQILRNANPAVPEELAEALAYGLAPELGHDLSETAVDLMIKRKEDHAIGMRMLLAAQQRPAGIPALLCTAYAQDLATAFGIPLDEACAYITGVEAEYRNQMMQYGGAFTLPENQTILLLAQMNAAIAEGYLEFFAASNGFPTDVTVAPATVETFIRAAITVVQGDYKREVNATYTYLKREMHRRDIRTCRGIGKENDLACGTFEEPATFALDQNFPNPFNPSTTISFTVPSTAVVSLDIYNIVGQKVRTLINASSYDQGYWSVVWDGTSDAGMIVPSGTYISRLTTPDGVLTHKMVMLK